MTDEAKPTPGPWRVSRTNAGLFISGAQPGYFCEVYAGNKTSMVHIPEQEANARLIAEAGTVYHETGLTPRQLAEQLRAIRDLIPINYLQRHDAPAATGPTASLDIVSAMRDYAEDRWKLYELAKQRSELLEALEAITAATWDTVDGSSPTNPIRKHLSNAEAALAKAKGDQS